jgi:hypothetical protein
LNDYIWINDNIYEYKTRQGSETKQSSTPSRSLNGTLCVDLLSNSTKGKFNFLFEVNQRQLNRLKTLWRLNSELVLKDWDLQEYDVACTSPEFSPDFLGESGGDYFYTIQLSFEQI